MPEKTNAEHLDRIGVALYEWDKYATGPRPGAHEAAMESLTALREHCREIDEQLEFDRSSVADCMTAANRAIDGRHWLTEGRGPYEWNDDRWHAEFYAAAAEIRESLAPLTKIAANWKDCPQKDADVARARIDLKAQNAALRAQIAETEREGDQDAAEFAALLEYARKAAGRRDVHSIHEVLDQVTALREQISEIEHHSVAAYIDDHGMTCDCCQHVMIDVTSAQTGEKQHCIAGDPEGDGVGCAHSFHGEEVPKLEARIAEMERQRDKYRADALKLNELRGALIVERDQARARSEALLTRKREMLGRVDSLEEALRPFADVFDAGRDMSPEMFQNARAALSSAATPQTSKPPHRVLCWKCGMATRSDSDHCQYCGVLIEEIEENTGRTGNPAIPTPSVEAKANRESATVKDSLIVQLEAPR